MKYAIIDNKKIVTCFDIKDINNIDDGDYNFIMIVRYLFILKLNLGFDEVVIFSDCKGGDYINITGNHSTEIGNIKEAIVCKRYFKNIDFLSWIFLIVIFWFLMAIINLIV